MGITKLIASGNPSVIDPVQSQLTLLDLSRYRIIRLSIGNWAFSPAPLLIGVNHIYEPNTPNASAITLLDSFTLARGDWGVSRLYEVPGQTVSITANPEGQASGCQAFYTLHAWDD